MVLAVRAVVMQHLRQAKLLPAEYVASTQLQIPMQLRRIANPLLGREAEVQQVTNCISEHHAAIIWGGPGEGKSSVAMEAGCRLWEAGMCLGGCFSINCTGVLQSSKCLALILFQEVFSLIHM